MTKNTKPSASTYDYMLGVYIVGAIVVTLILYYVVYPYIRSKFVVDEYTEDTESEILPVNVPGPREMPMEKMEVSLPARTYEAVVIENTPSKVFIADNEDDVTGSFVDMYNSVTGFLSAQSDDKSSVSVAQLGNQMEVRNNTLNPTDLH